jgi:hypothetical protein
MINNGFAKQPSLVPGRFTPPKKVWDRLIDQAIGYDFNLDQTIPQDFNQSGIVSVFNASGYDLPRFGIVGLNGPIILDSDNLNEFQGNINFQGIVPATSQHAGNFGILLGAIPENSVGVAVISGLSVVQMAFDPSNVFGWAEVLDGDRTKLQNEPAGSAKVLYLNTASSPGWAIVNLGAASDEARPVMVTSDTPEGASLGGYYPAKVFDQAKVFLKDCWMQDPNAASHPGVVPTTNIFYPGRRCKFDAGLWVYDVYLSDNVVLGGIDCVSGLFQWEDGIAL